MVIVAIVDLPERTPICNFLYHTSLLPNGLVPRLTDFARRVGGSLRWPDNDEALDLKLSDRRRGARRQAAGRGSRRKLGRRLVASLHWPSGLTYVMVACRRCFAGMDIVIFFWSGDRGEPPHVHVKKGAAEAKIWLEPVVLVTSVDLRSHEINSILRKVHEEQAAFLKAWHDHFRH